MTQAKHNNQEETSDEDHSHYHGVDRAEEHVSVENAITVLLENIGETRSQIVKLSETTTRILFQNLTSPFDLPKLPRSTRDGFAIRVPEEVALKEGVKEFRIIGDIRIGKLPKINLADGEAVRVATGSTIPNGASSVIMKEYSRIENGSLKVERIIRKGDNILLPGEDIRKGSTILEKGLRVRPHHLSLLSTLGIRTLKVYSKPRIAIFSTGDELVDSEKMQKEKRDSTAEVFDATRPFVKSMVRELGGIPVDLGIAKDNLEQIRGKLLKALRYDGVILSAGSSVGERDFVSKAIVSIGKIRTLIHGVAMRPSSPTGIASFRGKPILLLPGFPTSAIISFFVFGVPAILKLSGSSNTNPTMITAKLDDDFSGKKGVTHFLRVNVSGVGGKYVARIAKPTEAQFSGWLRYANGIVVLTGDRDPILKPGDEVSVIPIGDISA